MVGQHCYPEGHQVEPEYVTGAQVLCLLGFGLRDWQHGRKAPVRQFCPLSTCTSGHIMHMLSLERGHFIMHAAHCHCQAAACLQMCQASAHSMLWWRGCKSASTRASGSRLCVLWMGSGWASPGGSALGCWG